MNEDKIIIVDETGVEKEYTILFTFSLEDYNKDYVAFFEEGNEELFVSSYAQEGSEGGALDDITDSDEWDMIEEVIETFLLEDEVEEE